MSFHKLDKAKDKNFWSVRVNQRHPADRAQDGRQPAALLRRPPRQGVRVGGAAKARRRIRRPAPRNWSRSASGCRRSSIPVYVAEARPHAPAKPPLFANAVRRRRLLGYGVPTEWLADVRGATEDSIFELAEHLPQEAAEALLDLATGATPKRRASRRGRGRPVRASRTRSADSASSTNVEELERALDYPWDKWTVFLHPAQRETGRARTSAGRRVCRDRRERARRSSRCIARCILRSANPDARVLLTTYSETLANALRDQAAAIDRQRADDSASESRCIRSMRSRKRLYERNIGPAACRKSRRDAERCSRARRHAGRRRQVQPASCSRSGSESSTRGSLRTWEAYRDVARLGRQDAAAGKAARAALDGVRGRRADAR